MNSKQQVATNNYLAERLHNNSTLLHPRCGRAMQEISPAAKEMTFKPKVNVMPFTLYPEHTTQTQRSKQHIWEQLIEDTRKRNKLREEAKLLSTEQQFAAISFKPIISPFKSHKEANQNIFQRLFIDAEDRNQQHISHQLHKHQQKYAFSPQINLNNDQYLNSAKHNLNPIYKRIDQIMQTKRKNMQILLQQHQQQYSFVPQLQKKSVQMVKKNKREEVITRLLSERNKKAQRIEEIRKKCDADLATQLTFKPDLPNQYLCEGIVKKKSYVNPQQYTFVPKINELSSMLAARIDESLEVQSNRLAYQPLFQKQKKLSIIDQEAYNECVFIPRINVLSQTTDFTSHRPKPHHCTLIHQTQTEPTFHPQINRQSRLLTSSEKNKSIERSKNKFAVLHDLSHKKKEYEEIKDCSFKPTINKENDKVKYLRKSQRVKSVSGFDKYINTVSRAKSIKQQEKTYYEKVFGYEQKYNKRMKLTK